jgi:hypothetical protein
LEITLNTWLNIDRTNEIFSDNENWKPFLSISYLRICRALKTLMIIYKKVVLTERSMFAAVNVKCPNFGIQTPLPDLICLLMYNPKAFNAIF